MLEWTIVLVGPYPFGVHPRGPDHRDLLKGLDGEEGLTLGQVSHGTQPRRSRSYYRHSDRHSYRCSKRSDSIQNQTVQFILVCLPFH